jgi:Cdc6-like AAA superfamily ATPase
MVDALQCLLLCSLVINPHYLDDEKLPEQDRTRVLREIFNRNIREKQATRIISHLSPVPDNAHLPPALIYGPTGSGKTVTMIHVLSTFEKEVDIAESRLEVDKTIELINALATQQRLA